MTNDTDTIAALATAPGRGGVGIVRVSGPLAGGVAKALLRKIPQPRYAEYGPFLGNSGEILDEGIALYFPAPNSFTGEDVLELQGHGGPVVMDLLLEAVYAQGVRPAAPGEFSQRAFVNGKMDLAQAEAIADLIDASSRQAARSALRSLRGDFSATIDALVEQLIELRSYVESAIDFPDEEIDFLGDGQVAGRLEGIAEQLQKVLQAAQQGRALREGATVVLAGRPNAGKSSLLNALSGEQSAIVTDIPGTTRDVLRQELNLDGMPVHIIDTAGLRESDDPVEAEGIRRAWQEIERADLLLLLIDASEGIGDAEREILQRLPEGLPLTVVRNKIDLYDMTAASELVDGQPQLALSAKAGEGIDLLREHIKQSVGYHSGGEGSFMARRRHLDALQQANRHLENAEENLTIGAGELVAEELRLSQHNLNTITGEFGSDELLGRIFSSFCIGK